MAARSRTSATTVSTRSSPSAAATSLSVPVVQIGQNQLGALAVQAAGHLRADATGTTSDQDDFSVH